MMTAAELQKMVKARLQRTYANPTTVAQYMGGVSRVLKRVPMDLFGNVGVMRQYRQLLSEQTRKVFGVIWRKIFDEMMAAGLPCVEPNELAYSLKVPIVLAHAIDLLATRSSLPAVTEFRWKDVRFDGERAVIWNVVLEGPDLHVLRQVAEYCWPGQQPDPEAPIIPLHVECPMAQMPVEMAEDVANDLITGGRRSAESMSAYTLYDAMVKAGRPLIDIENRLLRLEDVSNMKRAARAKANATLLEVAVAARVGDDYQFERLWGVAMAGEYAAMPVLVAKTPPVVWTPKPWRPPLVTQGNDGKWRKVINLAKEPKAE